MSPSVLLFDLGGVIVDLGDPVDAIGLEMSDAEFWQRWLSSPLVRGFETGNLSAEQFIAQFGAELGFDDDADFGRRLRRWQLPVFTGAESFLRSLNGRAEIALLSNTNEIHWQHVLSQTDVFSTFSRLFLSFETGNAKPHAAAFEDVVAHFDCDASEIVFLDDNADNVRAAQAVGLRAKRVRGLGEVREAVSEHLG
jgi:putative hydrolase of the HAD superfamily